jgi:hypothetical protein
LEAPILPEPQLDDLHLLENVHELPLAKHIFQLDIGLLQNVRILPSHHLEVRVLLQLLLEPLPPLG